MAADAPAQSETAGVSSAVSAIDVFAAARDAQVPSTVLGGHPQPISPGSTYRRLRAPEYAVRLAEGSLVISPSHAMTINGERMSGWVAH